MKIIAKFKSDDRVIFEGDMLKLLEEVWKTGNSFDPGCEFEDFSSYSNCYFEEKKEEGNELLL